MKKLTKVIMSGAAVAALGATMAFGFAACGGDSETITISGSTSVQPLMQKLADAYMEENPDVTINVGAGGSGVGISNAQDGTVDLGMASEDVSGEEGITGIQIATDGIALITSASCTVSSVTKDQVYGLYVNHTAIQDVITDAISRDSSSGTRGAFEDIMGIETIYSGMPELSSQDQVIEQVAARNNVIGYCSLEALAGNTSIKGVNYEGIAPTTENVASGAYTLARPFNIMYNTANGMSEATAAFVDFIFSDAGAAIIEANGQVVVARQ